MSRLSVLIASHEFSPDQGSECAVGWNIATRMAAVHDVTVLCADGPAAQPNAYREAFEKYCVKHGPIRGLRVEFVAQPRMTRRVAWINRRLMTLTRGVGWQLLYFLGLDGWHRAALQKAREIGLENFDVVHQLTPVSFRRPGYFWTCGLPFFWGPIGGMTYQVPASFTRGSGVKIRLFEWLRSMDNIRSVRSAQFKGAARNARRIWTIAEDDRRALAARVGDKVEAMIDTSPPEAIAGYVHGFDASRPLRLCWSGQHEARKALPLLLDALARLPNRQRVVLDVIGAGPETRRWQELARQAGLTNIVWHGPLAYPEALQRIAQADVFVLSSYREAASMVVLEALGWGLPVICHDACGMAVAVDDTCGIKVPVVSPERSSQGFCNALQRLLDQPGLVELLSRGALERARELSWDAKVKAFAQAYAVIVSNRPDRETLP